MILRSAAKKMGLLLPRKLGGSTAMCCRKQRPAPGRGSLFTVRVRDDELMKGVYTSNKSAFASAHGPASYYEQMREGVVRDGRNLEG